MFLVFHGKLYTNLTRFESYAQFVTLHQKKCGF